MTKQDFMRGFLATPQAIRELILSDYQLRTVKYVRLSPKGVLSRDIAEFNDSSIQSAGALLSTLTRKGYLRRVEQVQASGGKEYLYFYALD